MTAFFQKEPLKIKSDILFISVFHLITLVKNVGRKLCFWLSCQHGCWHHGPSWWVILLNLWPLGPILRDRWTRSDWMVCALSGQTIIRTKGISYNWAVKTPSGSDCCCSLERKQISDYFNILSWFWTFIGTFSVHLAPVNPGWHLEGKNVISNRMLKTLNFQTGNFPPMEYGDSYKWPGDWTTQRKEKTFRKPCPTKTVGYTVWWWLFASVSIS